MSATTNEPTPDELEAFRRWRERNPTATAGVYWLDVADHGNAEYDAAILLRVLPSGTMRRCEVKHSGWIQELWDYIPRAGRRPAAGNGAYNLRRKEREAYYRSPECSKDDALLDSAIPEEAKKDARVWAATAKATAKKATAAAKATGPRGMTPAT